VIAAVIVAHRSEAHISGCLASLEGCDEVIVVDNSADGATAREVEKHPSTRLIRPGRNLGFAGGVNAGVQASRGALILILNPDCALEPGALTALRRELDQHPEAAIVGGALLDADGRPQEGFYVRRFPSAAALCCEVLGLNRLLPNNRINRWYRMLDTPLAGPAEVDQPAGALLLVRREVFDAVGGFDERFYPVWFEDVDFCLRVRRTGATIRFTPEARARHAGGHSVNRMDSVSKTLAWYGSLLRYSVKHFGPAGSKAVSVSLMLAALPRGIMGSLRARTLSPLRAFGAVSLRAMWILLGRSAEE
jgi:GT2 family glycosyltransferase